jgi:hypothetical protein
MVVPLYVDKPPCGGKSLNLWKERHICASWDGTSLVLHTDSAVQLV